MHIVVGQDKSEVQGKSLSPFTCTKNRVRIKLAESLLDYKIHQEKEPAQRGSKAKVIFSAHLGQAFDLPHVGELLDKQSYHAKLIRKPTEANC